MHQLVKNLRNNGVKEKYLRDDEMVVISQLLDLGIVYKRFVSGHVVYKLSNNAKAYKTKEGFGFEVVPNRHMGVIFDYDEVFECVSEDKFSPEFYCLTYKLNPSEEDVKNFDLGESVRVKVLARGYDIGNEGLLVKLPRSEENYFAMEKDPYITIGLANGAKSKNTSSLHFDEPISGKFVEGKKALIVKGKLYFNVKDIDVVSEVYHLEDGKNEVKKVNENKIVR